MHRDLLLPLLLLSSSSWRHRQRDEIFGNNVISELYWKSIYRLATRTRYQKSSTNLNMFSSHVRSISRWNFVQDMERICPGGHLLHRRSRRLHRRTRRRFRHSLAAAKRGHVTSSHRKLIAPHQAKTPLRVFDSTAACSVLLPRGSRIPPAWINYRKVCPAKDLDFVAPTTTTAAAMKNY